jgi:uroporphyrin-III C-methyltransferase/precorrin-2 dehydrogenase/sirohydrochlorin ferrochelatase
MDFYPLFARLANQRCLVVGGGEVARRKAVELLAAGATVTVNAKQICPALTELARTRDLRLHSGAFDAALLADHLLIIAATADPAVNATVAAAASRSGRLCNVVDDAESSTFIVPATVHRDPVVVAISSGGQAPLLSRLVRQRLERWLPPRLGELAAWAGRWRERARAVIPDAARRRGFWERLLAGPAARHALAGNETAADAAAARLLESGALAAATGQAWLVGAGPGDPGLITLRGIEVLQSADVILHDRLVAPALLACARREAEVINVGKSPGGGGVSQDTINELLVNRVRAGQRVCRLKAGDPYIFGRGGEEALALAAAGLAFDVIPGVTAAAGCSAAAGMPLTHRDLAGGVTLVTAQVAPGAPGPDWAQLARLDHTLVVYMGVARLGEICRALLEGGRSPTTPAAVVSAGTTAQQRQVTGALADIAAQSETAGLAAPALLFVGATAALAAQLTGAQSPAPQTRVACGDAWADTVSWPRTGTGL